MSKLSKQKENLQKIVDEALELIKKFYYDPIENKVLCKDIFEDMMKLLENKVDNIASILNEQNKKELASTIDNLWVEFKKDPTNNNFTLDLLEKKLILVPTGISELGEEILSKKYYAIGETCPQDLFKRVARVIAIPDLFDEFIYQYISRDVTVSFLSEIVEGYIDIIERVYDRRDDVDKLEFENVEYKMSNDEFEKMIKDKYGDNLSKYLEDQKESLKEFYEQRQKEYYDLMISGEFMPATPTLINIGNKLGMLSSCFFIRIEDSMEDIFQTVKDTAIISKMGGGVGLDVSNLRPKDAQVNGTNGSSSGAISFLKVFNTACNVIKSGGVRRSALLAAISVDHPDILEFIECKQKEGDLSNFNMSVFITDKFMKAVENDEDWEFTKFPSTKKYKARYIWDKVVENAWDKGDPGIIFEDTINKDNVLKNEFGNFGLNPCGEILLIKSSSCNLSAINLSKLKNFEEDLKRKVKIGIRFLDNVLDINNFPLQEIEEMSLTIRQLGLGVMGLHDLMLQNKIRYGSKESLDLIDKIFYNIKKYAFEESERLAKVRGIPKLFMEKNINRRNFTLLTCQPCGTVSALVGCSSGIEPVFNWKIKRKDTFGEHYIKHFILDQYDENSLPDWAVTASEVTPEEHVRVQAQLQKYIDNSISKTVNCSYNTTQKEISAIFKLAHRLGCKSTTVYRDGSRQLQVLNKVEDKKEGIKKQEKVEIIMEDKKNMLRTRPQSLKGVTKVLNTAHGKCYITLNEDEDGLREVFINVSKSGTEVASHTFAEGKLISRMLQNRIPVEEIIADLEKQKATPTFNKGFVVESIPDAIAKAMRDFVENDQGFSIKLIEEKDNDIDLEPNIMSEELVITKKEGDITPGGNYCPECGGITVLQSGCESCGEGCGWSRCG